MEVYFGAEFCSELLRYFFMVDVFVSFIPCVTFIVHVHIAESLQFVTLMTKNRNNLTDKIVCSCRHFLISMMPTCGICLEQCQRLKGDFRLHLLWLHLHMKLCMTFTSFSLHAGESISFSSSSVHLYMQITEGTILSLIWYSGGTYEC